MNKNQTLRDQIINHKFESYDSTEFYSFDNLTVQQLEELIDNDFIELDMAQNDSPTTKEFFELAKTFPVEVNFIGYAVGLERPDYRVTIEGMIIQGNLTTAHKKAFKQAFKEADELDISNNYCRAWYD